MKLENLTSKNLIKAGFFLGIGFWIPYGIITFIQVLWANNVYQDAYNKEVQFQTLEHPFPSQNIEIDDYGLQTEVLEINDVSRGKEVHFSLQNAGSYLITSLEVELKLLNKDGEVFETQTKKVSGPFFPKEQKVFSMIFENDSSFQSLEFTECKIGIVSINQ